MFTPQQNKKKTFSYNDSILESLRGLSGNVGKTVTSDVVSKVGSDAFRSLLGSMPASGELKPNREINIAEKNPQQPFRRPEVSAQMRHQEDSEIRQKIEAVRAELMALSRSITSLNTEVQKAVAEVPVHPGVYHVNFLERLRSVIKMLREQIDDSRTWLQLWSSRKKQKGYWGMYKKHGTNFGLSNERVLSTQAG
jgi:hypothetical protein